ESTTRYFWGDEIGKGNANCLNCGSEWDNSQTSPVGSFKPNRFGLYDMAGNVFQWVEDCFQKSYEGAPSDGSPWVTADCKSRVCRGGAWFADGRYVRSALRFEYAPDVSGASLGLRVARTL